MIVIITNKASYSREVQYYGKNQYVVLDPRQSMEISGVRASNFSEVSYYESLISRGFEVEFNDEVDDCKVVENSYGSGTTREDEDSSADSKTEESSDSPRGEESPAVYDLSKFSDDELKRIVQNLGVETRARARWKLESAVLENLPRDTSPESYL